MTSLANDLLNKSKPVKSKKPDGRVANQYGVVFRTNDGQPSTADKLSKIFDVSTYHVKRIYHELNKDYRLANKALEEYTYQG
jgi:hypothetical protein